MTPHRHTETDRQARIRDLCGNTVHLTPFLSETVKPTSPRTSAQWALCTGHGSERERREFACLLPLPPKNPAVGA